MFKQIGRSVTNYDYYAWEHGPVPREFWHELQNGIPEDFKGKLDIQKKPISEDITEIDFVPQTKANLSIFTPRERKVMDDLIFQFREVSPSKISEISHFKNKPWDITKREKGLGSEIDYLLAIDDEASITKELAEHYLTEKKEFIENYPIN